MLTRRECLRALSLAGLLPQGLLAHPAETAGLTFAAEPGLFPGDDLVSQISAAKQAGFQGFCDADLLSRSVAEQQQVLHAAEAQGVRLGPVHRPIMPGLPWDHNTWQPALLPLLMQSARLQLPGLRLSLGPQWTLGVAAPRSALWQQQAEFVELADTAGRWGQTLLLEPWDDGRGGARHFAVCRDFIAQLDHPAMKLSVDTYHWNAAGASVAELFRHAAALIGHVELADDLTTAQSAGRTSEIVVWFQQLRVSKYRGMIALRHGLSTPGEPGLIALSHACRAVAVRSS